MMYTARGSSLTQLFYQPLNFNINFVLIGNLFIFDGLLLEYMLVKEERKKEITEEGEEIEHIICCCLKPFFLLLFILLESKRV